MMAVLSTYKFAITNVLDFYRRNLERIRTENATY